MKEPVTLFSHDPEYVNPAKKRAVDADIAAWSAPFRGPQPEDGMFRASLVPFSPEQRAQATPKPVPPPPDMLLDPAFEQDACACLEKLEDETLRNRLRSLLAAQAEGISFRKACELCDFTGPMVTTLYLRVPGLKTLMFAARAVGKDLRKMDREDEAHRRAVEGWQEPVFSQKTGTLMGHIPRYSDRLMEVMLKADDPERYSDRSKLEVSGVVLNVQMGFDRNQLKEEVRKEKEVIEVADE